MDIFLSFLMSRLHGMSCYSHVSSLKMTGERSRLTNWDSLELLSQKQGLNWFWVSPLHQGATILLIPTIKPTTA